LSSRYPEEYAAYIAAEKNIKEITTGTIKVYRDKAILITKTLFLLHISGNKPVNPEEVYEYVMLPRSDEAAAKENIEHYELLLEEMALKIPQITKVADAYKFEAKGGGKADHHSEAKKELLANITSYKSYLKKFMKILSMAIS